MLEIFDEKRKEREEATVLDVVYYIFWSSHISGAVFRWLVERHPPSGLWTAAERAWQTRTGRGEQLPVSPSNGCESSANQRARMEVLIRCHR